MEQVGTPLEVYDDPLNTFVAGFIGSPKMNFLPAAAKPRNGSFVAMLTEFENVEVPFALADMPTTDSELLVGVRPEHFADDGEVRMKVTLDVIEHLGGTSFGYARSATERPLTIELRNRRQLQTGIAFELGFDPTRAFLFDRASGRRIR